MIVGDGLAGADLVVDGGSFVGGGGSIAVDGEEGEENKNGSQ